MDRLLGLLLFAGASYYLIQRNVGHMIAWLVILYLIARKCAHLTHTVSVMFGIVGIHVICMITKNTWEGFDKYIIFQTEELENTDDNKKLLKKIQKLEREVSDLESRISRIQR